MSIIILWKSSNEMRRLSIRVIYNGGLHSRSILAIDRSPFLHRIKVEFIEFRQFTKMVPGNLKSAKGLGFLTSVVVASRASKQLKSCSPQEIYIAIGDRASVNCDLCSKFRKDNNY